MNSMQQMTDGEQMASGVDGVWATDGSAYSNPSQNAYVLPAT
jgi:hypothetical protein